MRNDWKQNSPPRKRLMIQAQFSVISPSRTKRSANPEQPRRAVSSREGNRWWQQRGFGFKSRLFRFRISRICGSEKRLKFRFRTRTDGIPALSSSPLSSSLRPAAILASSFPATSFAGNTRQIHFRFIFKTFVPCRCEFFPLTKYFSLDGRVGEGELSSRANEYNLRVLSCRANRIPNENALRNLLGISLCVYCWSTVVHKASYRDVPRPPFFAKFAIKSEVGDRVSSRWHFWRDSRQLSRKKKSTRSREFSRDARVARRVRINFL